MNQAEKELKPPEPLVVKELDLLGEGERKGFKEPLESSKAEDSSQESPGNTQKKEETLNGPETSNEKPLPAKGLLEETERFFNLPALKVGIDQKGDVLGGPDHPITQKKNRFSILKAFYSDQSQGFLPMRKPHFLPIESDIRMALAQDFTQTEGKRQRGGQERDRNPFGEKQSILTDSDKETGLLVQEEIKRRITVSSSVQDKDPFPFRQLRQAFDPEEDKVILTFKPFRLLTENFMGDGKDAAFSQGGIDPQKPVAFRELFAGAVSYPRQGLQLLGVGFGEVGDIDRNQRIFPNLTGRPPQVCHPQIRLIPMGTGQGPQESPFRGFQMLRAYLSSGLGHQGRPRSQDSLHQLRQNLLSGLIHFFHVRCQIVVEFFLGTVDDMCRKFHVALLWVSGLLPKQPSALWGGLFIACREMYKL